MACGSVSVSDVAQPIFNVVAAMAELAQKAEPANASPRARPKCFNRVDILPPKNLMSPLALSTLCVLQEVIRIAKDNNIVYNFVANIISNQNCYTSPICPTR